MKVIKTYPLSASGLRKRQQEEEKLFSYGFRIDSEEETKDWQSGKACCLGLIFLPLALFGRGKFIKVTYIKEE